MREETKKCCSPAESLGQEVARKISSKVDAQMPNETLASDAMRRHLVFATHKETQNCVALLNITVKYSLLSIKYKFINFNINDIFKIHGYDFAKVFIFLMTLKVNVYFNLYSQETLELVQLG